MDALSDDYLFNACTLLNSAVEIENCKYMGMSGLASYKCYHCKNGFILKNDGTGCIEYDGDSRCIRSGENDTGCNECWWPYWFHGSLCKISNILHMKNITIILTFFLMNFIVLVF